MKLYFGDLLFTILSLIFFIVIMIVIIQSLRQRKNVRTMPTLTPSAKRHALYELLTRSLQNHQQTTSDYSIELTPTQLIVITNNLTTEEIVSNNLHSFQAQFDAIPAEANQQMQFIVTDFYAPEYFKYAQQFK